MFNSAKSEAKDMIERLPDDVSMEDIHYHLYVLEKVRKSEETVRNGGTIPHLEAVRRFEEWRKNWK